MTDWLIQMRLTVEEEKVREVQTRLRECVADVDSRPRFVTVEAWLVAAQEGLRGQREPLVRRAGSEHAEARR